MSKKQSSKRKDNKNGKKILKIIISVLIIAGIVYAMIVVRNSNKEQPSEPIDIYQPEIISDEKVYDNCEYGYANILFPKNKDFEYKYIDTKEGKDNTRISTYEYKDFKIQTIAKGSLVAKTLKVFKNDKEVYSNNEIYPQFGSLYCVKDNQNNIIYKVDRYYETNPIVYNNKLYFLDRTGDRFSVRYERGITTGYYYAIKYIDLNDKKYEEHVFYEYPGY